jgi:hypothetical protein
MAYKLAYSDYATGGGEVIPGPPGPKGDTGPQGPKGDPGTSGASGGLGLINVLDHGAKGDGATNDTAAIQNVLDTYAGKAVVFIPNTGLPYMTNPLRVSSNAEVLIHGTLLLRPGASHALLAFDNANNVTIRGHGTLDGNGGAQSVNGCGTLGGDNAHNARIAGLTFKNAFNWNVNITASSNVRLDGVSLIGGVNSNEFGAGCDNCWITNSYINGPSNDGGWTFYGGITNSGITNCIVTNARASGIGIYADGPQPAVCSNIVIANNVIHHNSPGGISVVTQVAGDPTHTGIVITGNRCYANANFGNPVYADIWLSHGSGVTISGNDLSGSGSGTNSVWGVFVGVASSHVNITGNTIWNEGQGGANGGGVYIQTANDVLVEANHFYDDQVTHTMSTAILGNAGARTAIINNLFGLLGGPPITLVAASDTVIVGPGLGGPPNAWNVIGQGVSYNAGHAVALDWNGLGPTIHVDGTAEGSLVFSGSHTIELEWGGQTVTVILDGTTQGALVRSTNAHQLTMAWGGSGGAALSVSVDGVAEGTVLTDAYMGSRPSAADDAAAAGVGVPVGGAYRNGSVMMIRVA